MPPSRPRCSENKGGIAGFSFKTDDDAQLFQRGRQFPYGATVHARRAVYAELPHAGGKNGGQQPTCRAGFMHIAGYGNSVPAARPAAYADDAPFSRAERFESCSRLFKDLPGLLNIPAFQHSGQMRFPFCQSGADKTPVGNGF